MRSFVLVQTLLLLYMTCRTYSYRRQQQLQQDDLDLLAERLLNHKENEIRDTKTQEKRILKTQQQEEAHEKILGSLKKREEKEIGTSEGSTKATLKREILHALIKLLHDELDKQEIHQQVAKDSTTAAEKRASENTFADELAVEKEAKAAMALREIADKRRESTEERRQQTTKRGENRMSVDHEWKDNEAEKRKQSDGLMRDELIRGPPGLWGDAFVKEDGEKKSMRAPPGLWGRDAEANEVMRARRGFLMGLQENLEDDKKSRVERDERN